jgi:hypothetical protein
MWRDSAASTASCNSWSRFVRFLFTTRVRMACVGVNTHRPS